MTVRTSARWTVVLLVSVALATCCIVAVRSRAVYGTFAFWGLPERINYCSRRYYPSAADVRGTPEDFTARVPGNREWRRVGRTYIGRDIHAVVHLDQSATVCTMGLYIETGGNRYRHYGLSGGP